jgi:hypothetical protein
MQPFSSFKNAAAFAAVALTALSVAAPGFAPVAAAEPTTFTPTGQAVFRTLSIDDPTAVEPTRGSAPLMFTVTLSGPDLGQGEQVTVLYRTEDVTAIGTPTGIGGDYKSADNSVTFGAGARTQPVNILISADGNDGVGRAQETFNVHLTGATGAVITKAIGVGRIDDRQQLPSGGGGGGTDPCSNNDDPNFEICTGPVTTVLRQG